MAATVKIDTRKLERALKVAPGIMAERLKKAADRVGARYRGHHRRQRIISGSRPIEAGKVRARSGGKNKISFKKAFGWAVKGNRLDNLRLDMTAKGFVAVRQEFGGVVRPRRGKYITVPMPEAKDVHGFIKKKSRDYLRSGRLIVIRSGKKRFLALPQKGKPPRLLFHLVRSVKLSPRLHYRGRTGEWKAYKPKAMRDFQYAVRAAIRAALKSGK